MIPQQLVDEEVAPLDHRTLRRVLAGVPPPHQHLLDRDALLARGLDRLISLGLVVEQLAVSEVAVHRDQDLAVRIGNPVTTRGAGEPAEHLAVDHAHPRAREHRHRQLRHHRQVERHPVPGLHPGEITQQRRELIHAPLKPRVGDLLRLLVLGLRHPDQRVLAPTRFQVAVDAVHAGVQAPADPPLPERRIAGVQDRVPPAVPLEHLRVLDEAVRVALLLEPLQDRRVVRVRLLDEILGRRVVLLLAPVNRDLRLRHSRLGRLSARRCLLVHSHPQTSQPKGGL